MKAIFFPKNNLSVNVCRCFNGHLAPITFNTDRLKDGKYALAEVEAFRNDVQLTSFLNPRYDFAQENLDYGDTLNKLDKTGRWSWGLYYNTNAWLNPFSGVVEIIPGYGQTTWSQLAVDFYNAHGASIVAGTSKAANYPNHGGNLYVLTNGHMGFDNVTGAYGSETQGRESIDWLEYQINVFVELIGKHVTSISYMNGIVGFLPIMLIPYIFAGRNSNKSISGNSNIIYQNFLRQSNINRANNTRAWDSSQSGEFPSQQASIDYTKTQVQYAIDNQGLFTDFAHIHSFYEYPDLPFISLFYSQMRSQIGNQDVWNAGYGEAFEYAFMRDSLKKFGSFEHDNELYFFFQVKDKYKGTFTSITIPNDLDYAIINTPLSFEIDTTGTYLSGKNIKCDEAVLIRNLGSDKWVISVPYRLDEEGYARFKVYEGIAEYYSATRPTITRSGNTITTDIPSKVVVWRKPTAGGLADVVEVGRYNDSSTSHTHPIEAGYNYYIGAISNYNHSNLIELIG